MIPLSTTRVDIERPTPVPAPEPADIYDDPALGEYQTTSVATDVRATIGPPSVATDIRGGNRAAFTAPMACDPADLRAGDTVVEPDGTRWLCLYAHQDRAVGLSFTSASLRRVTGAS